MVCSNVLLVEVIRDLSVICHVSCIYKFESVEAPELAFLKGCLFCEIQLLGILRHVFVEVAKIEDMEVNAIDGYIIISP